MTEPFAFWGCHDIRESLGVRAATERQLADRLRTVDGDSIFYHSVRCLLRHQVGSVHYPDDFARWAAVEAGDPELAERLALFSPFDLPSADAFRSHLVATIEDHLAAPRPPRPVRSPFRFLRAHLAQVPTGIVADDLATLRAGLQAVDDSSIYFHAVESPGRNGGRRSDIAAWVEDALGLPDLAARLGDVDPFVAGIGRTRSLYLAAIEPWLAPPG
jgi:hypothetical protein